MKTFITTWSGFWLYSHAVRMRSTSGSERSAAAAASLAPGTTGSELAYSLSNTSMAPDVFLGTSGHGHTFPGATVPWGMVQATPWTWDQRVKSWDLLAGFNSRGYRSDFYGIGHTALSGIGCGSTGEVRLLPTIGSSPMVLDLKSARGNPGFFSCRAAVKRHPGRNLRVDVTATKHGAVHKYTFPKGSGRQVSLLLQQNPKAEWGPWTLRDYNVSADVGTDLVEGCTLGEVNSWSSAVSYVCFTIRFSANITRTSGTVSDTIYDPMGLVLSFGAGDEPLVAQVGLSRTSLEGARANFAAELADKDFSQVQAEARDEWEKVLGVVKATFHRREDSVAYYSALYHAMLAPTTLSDVDGSFRLQNTTLSSEGAYTTMASIDEQLPVQRAPPGGPMYSTFSFWDTYRTLHPLINLINPTVAKDFGRSMHVLLKAWKFLPNLQAYHSPANLMEGDGGTVALATMARLGLVKGEEVFPDLLAGRNDYAEDGRFLLHNHSRLSEVHVSEYLEQAKADACLAKLADDLGLAAESADLANRSDFVYSLWDSSTNVFGMQWADRSPKLLSENHEGYREGSPQQYSWDAEWSVPRMVDARGGRQSFLRLLDDFFFHTEMHTKQLDMTGNFGGMSMGNEPTLHTPYLYSAIGCLHKTQYVVDKAIRRFFTSRRSGLPGNDDMGEMSSWLAFSALGFYPLDSCSGLYMLGRPTVNQASVQVSGGTLAIEVHGQAEKNIYSSRVRWNGQDLDLSKPWISHRELQQGGLLEFWMGPDRSSHDPMCNSN